MRACDRGGLIPLVCLYVIDLSQVTQQLHINEFSTQ